MMVLMKYLSKSWNCFKLTTVEPIGFFNFLAFNVFILTLQTGLYDVICYQEFHKNRTINCHRLKDNKEAEDTVQRLAAQWNIIFGVVHFVPAVIAHILLGAWSDRNGRQINILVGLAGLLINVFPLTVILTFKETSIWYLAFTSFISGATGYLGIVNTSSFAYLSDITVNRKNLTVRMVNYSIAMSLAGIIGAFLAATFQKSMKFPYIILFIEFMLAIAFFYCLIRVKQIPPAKLKMLQNGQSQQISSELALASNLANGSMMNSTSRKATCAEECCEVLQSSKILVKEVWHTYSKKRTGKRRAYIVMVSIIFFLHIFAEMGLRGNVTSLYVFRRPLAWSGPTLGYWKTVHNTVLFFGNVIGALLFKKILKLKETTILVICLLSTFGELVATGLATSTWIMFFAASLGTFSQLLVPTAKAFMTALVDPDEVGKSYIAFGLAADFGYGVSNMAANGIYGSTIKFFPGFIFMFGAFMTAVSILMMIFIHVDFRREDQQHRNEIQVETNPNQLTDDTSTIATTV